MNYTGPIWVLLEASRWVEAPYSITSCTLDLDHDGEPECLMTTDQVFSFFEIDSGALVFLFTMHEDGDGIRNVHQLVGPSSQLITGLSHPAAWVKKGRQSSILRLSPVPLLKKIEIYSPRFLGNSWNSTHQAVLRRGSTICCLVEFRFHF